MDLMPSNDIAEAMVGAEALLIWIVCAINTLISANVMVATHVTRH